MKKLFLLVSMLAILLLAAGCSTPADVASYNLSKEADMFKVDRRIIFYNGITGEYMLVIEGRCSLGNNDSPGELTVTCKTGETTFKKHFLGLSDNVTYFAQQIEGADVDTYHYKVIFNPATILPDIQVP